MSDRTDILQIASAEIGYKEGRNNDNKYGKYFAINNQPWCAMFVCWCARQAGLGQEIIPFSAYVPDFSDKYGGRLKKRGTYTPQPGDLILFDFNLNNTPDHIGIVESLGNNAVTTIEGNTSSGSSGSQNNGDGVYRRIRSLNDATTFGFWLPEYENGYRQYVQEQTGFDNNTMVYLDEHPFSAALYEKLYKALTITTSREMVQLAADFDDNTMKYLNEYKYADSLYDKLAATILDMKNA